MAVQPYSDLTKAYPNLSRTTAQVSSNILKRLKGELSPETQAAIQDASARFGVANGMPGAGIVGNRTARDLGRATEDIQSQGGQDFLNAIGVYSGNLAPGARDIQQNSQFNADLGFRNTQANRQFGLQQNEQQLNAAKFNEQFGPKYTGTAYKFPNQQWQTEPGGFWSNERGQMASNPGALTFKYKY